jgi:hypothetical protein
MHSKNSEKAEQNSFDALDAQNVFSIFISEIIAIALFLQILGVTCFSI